MNIARVLPLAQAADVHELVESRKTEGKACLGGREFIAVVIKSAIFYWTFRGIDSPTLINASRRWLRAHPDDLLTEVRTPQ